MGKNKYKNNKDTFICYREVAKSSCPLMITRHVKLIHIFITNLNHQNKLKLKSDKEPRWGRNKQSLVYP